MMVSDASEAAIPHMMFAEQIVPDEFNVCPICNGRLPTAPQEWQLKPRVFRNHVAQSRLQLRGRNMLIINASQDVAGNRLRGLARLLSRVQLNRLTKDDENVPQNGVRELGIRAGRRTKMPIIADPMVDIFEDIEQVTLRHPLFEQGFERFEVLRDRES